jgi:hypothetical protein
MVTVMDLLKKRKGNKGVGAMAAEATPRHGLGQGVPA